MNKHISTGMTIAAVVGLVAVAATVAPAQTQMPMTIKSGQTKTTQATRRSNVNSRNQRYYRRNPNVTLNFRNASVRTALIQLFRKAHRDYSLTEDVSGVVNLRITNKPLDQALRLIVNSSTVPLTYTVDSGVYFIRPRAIQATRGNTVVAQAEPAQSDYSQQPNFPGQVENANTPVTPQINYLGNFNNQLNFAGGGVPGYPNLPTFYNTPFASQGGYYFTPFNGGFGNTISSGTVVTAPVGAVNGGTSNGQPVVTPNPNTVGGNNITLP